MRRILIFSCVAVLLALPFFYHWMAGAGLLASFVLATCLLQPMVLQFAQEEAFQQSERRRIRDLLDAEVVRREKFVARCERDQIICEGLMVVATLGLLYSLKKLWDTRHG